MALIMCIIKPKHSVIVHHGKWAVGIIVVVDAIVAGQVAVKEGRKGRMGSSGTVLR